MPSNQFVTLNDSLEATQLSKAWLRCHSQFSISKERCVHPQVPMSVTRSSEAVSIQYACRVGFLLFTPILVLVELEAFASL